MPADGCDTGAERHDLLTTFEGERDRLVGLAAHVLGSRAEADDVVQEAWLRLSRTDRIDDPAAWLTTVVTRLCLDTRRRHGTRTRAEGAAPSRPEPIEPDADVVAGERVGEAVHVVLDRLAPAERVAFVLHDVFGHPFDEVSAVLGRSDTAVRQLASRARRRVAGTPVPDDEVARAEHTVIVDAFLAAARGGDLAALMSLLAPDAVMLPDRHAQAMGVPPVFDGAIAVADRFNGAKGAAPVTLDGERGAAWIARGTVMVAFVFHVGAGRIHEIEQIADPDVLATFTITRRRPQGADA